MPSEYNCTKCNKVFNSFSKLERHKNNKTPCDVIKVKEELKCELCNVKFTRPSHQKIHEQTQKHITNVQIHGNYSNNGSIVGGCNNTINQHLINLTLNMRSFKDTDISYIGYGLLRDIGLIYQDIKNKVGMSEVDKISEMFNEVIVILKKLHFNIAIEENHNLKILLIFPGIKKLAHEYLILEINKETNYINWRSLDYIELLSNIFEHLLTLNEKSRSENYIEFVNYLKEKILEDAELHLELKPIIDKKLSDMYINFNKEQNKPEREVKDTIDDKYKEFKNYRQQETRLSNGLNPEIIDTSL